MGEQARDDRESGLELILQSPRHPKARGSRPLCEKEAGLLAAT